MLCSKILRQFFSTCLLNLFLRLFIVLNIMFKIIPKIISLIAAILEFSTSDQASLSVFE